MRSQFVVTQNAKSFMAGLKALEQRGANEACVMVVDGIPGLGKTTTVEWWAVQTGAIFLRAKEEWTPTWFMRELLAALRETPEHSFEKMFRQAVTALSKHSMAALRDGKAFGVVVDEVDHISRNKRMVETIRDLSDMLEIPFIMVGMGKVRANLTRFPQVASRVGQYVEFALAPLSDAQALVDALCEVQVAPCLVEFLHKVSGGKFREIKEGIAAIERFGKRNPPGDGGMTVAKMAGQVLLNDRDTGNPITVRG